ncbi:hypothetical protein QR90_08630 [Deinococcus radiopugnans]|uniref:DNA (cytosine-5-)-methyltransferase n=1 Tax=Deinococcus radiopugnans TaxID=57497 RepID=A0A0A7KKR3_9DEIO|nr:DNA cytosine methyltransferase [Deinococcus radiopugnans]AIZ45153.1 hypothetical protein QR90_08630 [Deinococcus radiopugnans]
MRAFEFFSGGGMVHAALDRRHWQTTFANDVDPMKAATYAANWGHGHLVVGDVAGLTSAQLPGHADLAWASSPCQDVSLAGSGAGLGLGADGFPRTRSGTFWLFWRLIEQLRVEGRAPRVVILENVPGLLTSSEGRDFQAVCQAFAASGYRFGPILLDAVQFLPHSRPRLFVVGVASGLAASLLPRSPAPVDGWHVPAMTRALDALSAEHRDLWHWWDPPSPPPRTLSLAALLEADHAVAWDTPAQTRRLLEMMQVPSARRVAQARSSGTREIGTLYRRGRQGVVRAEVRFDGVSGCLRTPGGGSSKQTVMVVDGGQVRTRLLTPREGARLMGLPDQYVLPENNTRALQVVGDGVAVPVVRYVLAHLVEPAIRAEWLAEAGSPADGRTEACAAD